MSSNLTPSAMTFPKKIKVLSDDNELEFVAKVPFAKKDIAKYIYTKSETKKGMEVTLILEDIISLIEARLMLDIS